MKKFDKKTMSFKKKGTKNATKKTTKKEVEKIVKSYNLPPKTPGNNSLLPDSKVITCMYSETGFQTSTISPANYFYRLNSIFDPNATGVGSSVKNFATISANYNKYRVTEASVTIRAISSQDAYIGILPYDDPGALSTFGIDDFSVQNNVKINMRPAYAVSATKLTAKYDIAKMMGVSKNEYMTDDQYAAAIGSNPANVQFLSLFSQNIDEITGHDLRWLIQIKYKVILTDVKTLPL